MMRTALITIVHGRHDHLRRQRDWIQQLVPQPALHVVVSMGDPDVEEILTEVRTIPTRFILLESATELPLARARNVGAAEAISGGAEALVLLDVDCLPERRLVEDYGSAFATLAGDDVPAVVCGRVRYVPEGVADAEHRPEHLSKCARDHPLRVVPEGDAPVRGDVRMLWSLNMALTVRDWRRVGGFDERYTGYGAEDTDFGQRLAEAGGAMWWTSAAGAFHQHHPVSNPPVRHLEAIVKNANLFASLWGFEPMRGWLEAFRDRGLAVRTADGWRVVDGKK